MCQAGRMRWPILPRWHRPRQETCTLWRRHCLRASGLPLEGVAGIGAWNYLVQIACWKVRAGAGCGNAFILRPSEMTPLSETALPKEVCRGHSPADCSSDPWRLPYRPGDLRTSRHCQDMLTIGVETGGLIMAQSAQSLKKVTLELGGKSPLIVFADADFDVAVQTALDANFYTAGEVCSNATRILSRTALPQTSSPRC